MDHWLCVYSSTVKKNEYNNLQNFLNLRRYTVMKTMQSRAKKKSWGLWGKFVAINRIDLTEKVRLIKALNINKDEDSE